MTVTAIRPHDIRGHGVLNFSRTRLLASCLSQKGQLSLHLFIYSVSSERLGNMIGVDDTPALRLGSA